MIILNVYFDSGVPKRRTVAALSFRKPVARVADDARLPPLCGNDKGVNRLARPRRASPLSGPGRSDGGPTLQIAMADRRLYKNSSIMKSILND